MTLAPEDRLKHLLPARLYFPYKIAKESGRHEPELAILSGLLPARGTAIDVGANRGIYSYALASIVERVEAFEPHPLMAAFLRRKLAPRVRVHEVALSRNAGAGWLIVLQDRKGADQHLVSRIVTAAEPLEGPGRPRASRVAVRRLDDFTFTEVVFIKIDTEGSDMAVIAGAAQTIAACRPILLVELLAGSYRDPLTEIAAIEDGFGYQSFLVVSGQRIGAREALSGRAGPLRTSNVLFMPR